MYHSVCRRVLSDRRHVFSVLWWTDLYFSCNMPVCPRQESQFSKVYSNHPEHRLWSCELHIICLLVLTWLLHFPTYLTDCTTPPLYLLQSELFTCSAYKYVQFVFHVDHNTPLSPGHFCFRALLQLLWPIMIMKKNLQKTESFVSFPLISEPSVSRQTFELLSRQVMGDMRCPTCQSQGPRPLTAN